MSIWKISTLWQSRDLPSLRQPLYYSFRCFFTSLNRFGTQGHEILKLYEKWKPKNCKTAILAFQLLGFLLQWCALVWVLRVGFCLFWTVFEVFWTLFAGFISLLHCFRKLTNKLANVPLFALWRLTSNLRSSEVLSELLPLLFQCFASFWTLRVLFLTFDKIDRPPSNERGSHLHDWRTMFH
mgnify:CR=1 FL=1